MRRFLNRIWRMEPAERPTFTQLLKAIEGDAETLEAWPDLAWLSGPKPAAAEVVSEMKKRVQRLKIDLSSVEHSLKAFVTEHHSDPDEAFNALDCDGDGDVDVQELMINLGCTDVQAAEIMHWHDANGDGIWQHDEFVAFIDEKYPAFTR